MIVGGLKTHQVIRSTNSQEKADCLAELFHTVYRPIKEHRV